jgi:uncharacterized protein
MAESIPASSGGELAPIPATERIQALDVIRGFALIGIFLMNVEWFTRPITELGTGVDLNQHGLSSVASWFVYTFVQGKFWTMFSLLFGMGFAVMLTRAEVAGREFVRPYVRRIIGLFLFGLAHFILVWTGDILHNYAITALALLLIVTRSWKAWLAILASVGITALALKSEAMAMSAAFLVVVAVLMFVLNRGSLARYYRIGVAMYLLPFVLGLGYIGVTAVMPGAGKPTPAEAQQRSERMAERARDRAEEVRVFSTGSYSESVAFRARAFAKELPDIAGLSLLALPMFMIGFWFVRSGVIANLRQNLPLFQRLLRWTLPLGLAVTLLSVWMHSSFLPGTGRQPVVAAARVLFEIGALPLCIGYVAALMCLLATGWGERLLAPLRHAGRMALTNYLGASLIGTWYFSGYGLGHYGQVSRGGQVLFVAVVFSAQLFFSYLWLSRFRYGPMEWLWRAITYWQLPAMRRQPARVAEALAPGIGGA